MPAPILATKLYIPPPRPEAVPRPRLTERLDEGSNRRLTLVCAPAGFGKTTLVGEWLADCDHPAAWLSLDRGDSDPARFLTYLVAALQTIEAGVGEGILVALRSPRPPPTEAIMTALLNEIITVEDDFILVLDDYHVIDSKSVGDALAFLLEHLPPQMHLVAATREDPNLPLARLRVRGQLTELRAADLRFTPSEAAEFLNRVMGLDLSEEDVAALEARTEGWIAGLQLAAISMRGHEDTTAFIESFTGGHHFVLDYLLEEVLDQQPEYIQTFLLRTSILDSLCGSLCDAVLPDLSASGQETLEHLEHANLFIVPLDEERHWYRYHHLFADLLRQRQSVAASTENDENSVAELHKRASIWHEENGLVVEAFRHAAAADDVERAARLVEGGGTPLIFRGAAAPVLDWLESLPTAAMDAMPSLWMTYATSLFFDGQIMGVELKLKAAEAALKNAEPDDENRDIIGRIAAMRATLAIIPHDVEAIIAQSRRALEYLRPDNLPVRTATTFTLGYAYQLRGGRAAARRAYTEVLSFGDSDPMYTIAATLSLGQIQEMDNELSQAARTYERVVRLAGDPPWAIASEAHIGLARIHYQWNDLDTAEHHGQQCLHLTQHMESTDTIASYAVFLARLKLAQRDAPAATAVLDETEAFVREHGFEHRLPDIAAAQVLTLLHRGNVSDAARKIAETHEIPVSQARIHLAEDDPSAALAALDPLRQQMEASNWEDERLRVMVLQALARHAHGEKDEALRVLGDALAMAEPGGFIRIFVDEGIPMARLLSEAASHGIMPDYTAKLLAVFEAEAHKREGESHLPPASSAQPLVEPLSQRELEVLRLIAQGLSNREIGERLFLALDTVKGHNRRIFGKLSVQRRTEAVAKARSLNILPRQN